jgi:hypothetical protein
MELQFKTLENQDYDTLCTFWKQWGFFAPPKDCLPNNGLGGIKIITPDNIIVCAGFLYETNSRIAWIEFIVANPEIKDKTIRHNALIELISLLTIEAKEKGYSAVFASITNQSLINKYVEVGYTKNEIPSTELTIKL